MNGAHTVSHVFSFSLVLYLLFRFFYFFSGVLFIFLFFFASSLRFAVRLSVFFCAPHRTLYFERTISSTFRVAPHRPPLSPSPIPSNGSYFTSLFLLHIASLLRTPRFTTNFLLLLLLLLLLFRSLLILFYFIFYVSSLTGVLKLYIHINLHGVRFFPLRYSLRRTDRAVQIIISAFVVASYIKQKSAVNSSRALFFTF